MGNVLFRKCIIAFAFLCLLSSFIIKPSVSYALDITFDLSNYKYRETDDNGNFQMSDDAASPFVSVGIRDWDMPKSVGKFGLMYTAEVTHGRVNYDSKNSGVVKKTYNKARAEAYVTYRTDKILSPFVGFGYRYLRDESGGQIGENGGVFYDRRSRYYYAPVGVVINVTDKFTFKGQYNFFIKGEQKSYLMHTNPGYPNVSNEQDDGWGADFTLNYQATENLSLYSFYRHWNIGKSEIATGYVPVRNETISWWEPDNTTHEFGLGVAYNFNSFF